VTATAHLNTLADRLGLRGTRRARAARGPCVSDWPGFRSTPCFRSAPCFGGGTRAWPGPVNSHPRLTDDVGDRLKVVQALLLRASRQPHDVPAARRDEPGRMLLAQVVRVWLLVGGQRPEDGRRVPVHERERVDGRLLARRT